MRGPSKFVWAGLTFVRGPHPAGKPAWFHTPLKLAVVETHPDNFTAYAELNETINMIWSNRGDWYAHSQHTALDALLEQLAVEEQLASTAELRTRAAELIFEIELGRAC